MAQENQDDDLIRRYLLGRLQESELERLEERMMVDTEFYDQVVLAEDEMVEDYMNGELPENDVAAFEVSFLSTPEGRQQVAYAKALSEFVSDHSSDSDEEERENGTPVATPPKATTLETKLLENGHQKPHEPKDPNNVLRPAWWRRPEIAPYLAAAAAVVVIAVGVWLWPSASNVKRGLAALNDAYHEQRPIEARISGFGYAPAITTRGGEPKVDRTARNLAESILLEAVLKHPSAATHHAAGRLYLAEKKFDEAIEQFEEALKLDPNSAQLHSDYGAALVEKGKEDKLRGDLGKSSEEFGQSNEHLSRALELSDSLLEALFNRALCKEYLLLYRGAAEDWKNYIQKDPKSKWADEARLRLQEIETRLSSRPQERSQLLADFLNAQEANDDTGAWAIICKSRDVTGSILEDGLLEDYVDHSVNGPHDKAAEGLRALAYAGEVARSRSGDLLIPKLVRFYESMTPSQRHEVWQAQLFVKSARESFSKNNFEAAQQSYNNAKLIFERVGDVQEVTKMNFAIGNTYLQQSQAEAALRFFRPLARQCETSGFRFLLAQTYYSTSGALQYFRDFSSALNSTTRSIEVSNEMGDVIGVLKARYQLGELYRFVNNDRKALDIYFRDLPRTGEYFLQPMTLWSRYFSISRVFDELTLYATAVDFQNEALQFARQANAARVICRSQNYLGFILAKQGKYLDAQRSIESALEAGNSLAEERVRKEATAYSLLQLGYLFRLTREFGKAIENYDQAIRSYDELDSQFFAFTARKNKLLCCVDQEFCGDVEQELEAVLSLFEAHRSKILEESNRNTFFDAEQTIYDVAMEFEYFKKGNSLKAFEYSEKSRGRSLSDMTGTSVKLIDNQDGPDLEFQAVSKPLDIVEVLRLMPPQSQILQYAVLKDSLLIWVVSKDGVAPARAQRIAIGDLNMRVDSFRRLASSASESELEEFSRESVALYDLLVNPVIDLLDTSKQLCIVPDKVLNYLPFPALKSSVTGRYFVDQQENGLVMSASSSLFIRSSGYANEKASTNRERLLCIGDPLFDAKEFPHLNRLQSAATEAQIVSTYYGPFPPLVGATATKRRVMSEMEKSDVIHLATHAIIDETYPIRSKLLLAKSTTDLSGEESGILQAYEIFRLNLSRTKLVVLSACQTGIGKYYAGEGMIGLSRAFIAKRIPLVVASLWAVDSSATARLMIAFHKHRKLDAPQTALALRRAQLEMLTSSNDSDRLPRNWAAFVAIGGYAEF